MSDFIEKAVPEKESFAEREILIENQYGIHARPAAMLVKTASMFNAEITITKGSINVSGKSIMGLMTLEACYGSMIRVTASGPDAMQALDEIQKLFEQKFNEE